MSVVLDERLIDHILSNRPPYADALDLLAIRDAIGKVEAELSELKGRKLAWVNKPKIQELEKRLMRYQLAEIPAREHVRASPVKTAVLKSELAHREAKVIAEEPAPAAVDAPDTPVKEPAARPPTPSETRNPSTFDRLKFLTREARSRAKVATKVDDDDDELADTGNPRQ